MTALAGQAVLVTGANRGIGREYVLELLERGASKVYATARRVESVDFNDSRVVPLFSRSQSTSSSSVRRSGVVS